jgi:hypothetical protein
MEGKKEEIWYFLPYFLPPMFTPQNPSKGLTRLKFSAILISARETSNCPREAEIFKKTNQIIITK